MLNRLGAPASFCGLQLPFMPCGKQKARLATQHFTAAALWPWEQQTQAPASKVIHLVRHGETEMNVHLAFCRPSYGQPGFVDPLLYDTRLTANGQAQAQRAAAKVATLLPAPEVVVISPLTRALQTADVVFGGQPWPRVVQPLAAERLYLSSDVGRHRELLEQDFPHHDFAHLPLSAELQSAAWWHVGDTVFREAEDSQALPAFAEEPEEVFLRRVELFRRWLEQRTERSIAVVSHWGVLQALTGSDFHNCEIRMVRFGQLHARPHLLETAEAGH